MNRPLTLLTFILTMTTLLAVANPGTAAENPTAATELRPPVSATAGDSEALPLIQLLKAHKATVRAEELRVDQLLQAIGRQAGINIVVAADITETISFDVRDISFYEVFHFIMETRQLRYRQLNNVILVEKDKVKDKAEAAALQQELLTVRVCPRYGQASEFIEQLRPLVSTATGGSITVTARDACLLLKDREENLQRLEELLIELDRPIPQVHIEARIVTVTNEAKKQLGVDWNYDNLSTRNPLTAATIMATSTSPNTNITFGFLRNNLDLNVKLQAMQDANLADLLSAPSVLVLNGEEAIIKQGQEVPYTSSTAAGTGVQTNTSFREATLSLKVTPRVIQNAFVNLKVHVTNDSVATNMVGDQPLIDKQEINTRLFLKNGATVVIGGILKKSQTNYTTQVPGLGDIPILGQLFKSIAQEDSKRELLVFITTTVVNLEQVGEADNTNPDYIRKEFGLRKDNTVGKGGM